MKPTVFFSYSRQDSEFALRLGKDLRAAGGNIWLDQLDIKPGDRWDATVEKGLTNSAQILVILSPASVASNNVMDEVSYALEENKLVIPVLHLDCEIPFRLRRLQYTDFRSDYQTAFDLLVKTLNISLPPTAGSDAAAENVVQSGRGDSESNSPLPSKSSPATASNLPKGEQQDVHHVRASGAASNEAGVGIATAVGKSSPAEIEQNYSSAKRRRTIWIIGTVALILIAVIGMAMWPKTPEKVAEKIPVSTSPVLPAPVAPKRQDKPPSDAGLKAGGSTKVEPKTSPSPTPTEPKTSGPSAEASPPPPTAPTTPPPTPPPSSGSPGAGQRPTSVQINPNVQIVASTVRPVQVINQAKVRIVNANSGLCLTSAGGVRTINASIVQFPCDDDPSRFWSVSVVSGTDFVMIKNLFSGLCLTIAGGVTDRNATAVQYTCDTDPSRRWRYSGADPSAIQLVNVNSRLCLTTAGGSTERNVVAVQYLCDGERSRSWQIRSAP